MKKLYLIAAALLTFASCSNEEEILNDNQQNDYHRIAAVIEQGAPESRGSIDGNNTFSFFDGEVIQIFVDDPNMPSYDYKYDAGFFVPTDAEIPAGTTILGAYYGGTDGEDGDYPYASGSLEGNMLNIGLPQNSEFLYNPNHNVMLPLWGELNGNGLYFKHLAGVLRVNMSNLPEGYEVLAVHSSNPMSGDFFVEDITVDEPYMEGTESGENAEGLMTIQFQETTANTTDKTLYIPLPVGTYQNIQVLVSKNDEDCDEGNYNEAITLAYWENKTVARATIYTANLNSNTPKNNLSLVKSVFANGGYLTLTENVTLDGPLTVAAGKTVKLNLNGFTLTTSESTTNSVSDDITNEGTLIIKDGTIQSANTAIWSKSGELNLENCEIYTSDSRVNTVAATGGTVNIQDCKIENTATSAADTKDHYVIGLENVTEAQISSSEVTSNLHGAIGVYNTILNIDGGTYKAGNFYAIFIKKSSVNYTGGATFTPANGWAIIYATANSIVNDETLASDTSISGISTLTELESAFNNGGIFMLSQSIELNTPFTLASGKLLTIDLGGNMLKTSTTTTTDVSDDIINEGTLTIKNGTIESANTAIWSKSGELNLEHCVVSSSDNRVNTVAATGGTLKIKGGSIMNIADGASTDNKAHYVIGLKDVSDALIEQADVNANALGAIGVDNSTLKIREGNYMSNKYYALYLSNGSTVTHEAANFQGHPEWANIFASAGCTVNETLYSVDTPIMMW